MEEMEVKVTWRLAWGLAWRFFLMWLGVTAIIWLIMFLVGFALFAPFMGGW